MSKMTDSDIKKHIKNGVKEICPDKGEELWNQPVTRASGDEWFLDGVKKPGRRPGKVIWMVPSFAACAVVCFLFLHLWNFRTEATIYLDVNPSIEMEINRNEKVLSARANNEDGKVVLGDMNLKNTDLEVAVHAILGSMVKQGYLSEARSMILLSIDSADRKKADEIRVQLSEDINGCLTSLLGGGGVLHQDIRADDKTKSLAGEYGISPGKAALLQKITEDYPKLSYSSLAEMSMNQLPLYLEKQGVDIRDYTGYTGSGLSDDEEKEELLEEEEEKETSDKEESEEKDSHEDDADKDEEPDEPDEEDEEPVKSKDGETSGGIVSKPDRSPSLGGTSKPGSGGGTSKPGNTVKPEGGEKPGIPEAEEPDEDTGDDREEEPDTDWEDEPEDEEPDEEDDE